MTENIVDKKARAFAFVSLMFARKVKQTLQLLVRALWTNKLERLSLLRRFKHSLMFARKAKQTLQLLREELVTEHCGQIS